jgi:heme-degrading monooxygenase HmoA
MHRNVQRSAWVLPYSGGVRGGTVATSKYTHWDIRSLSCNPKLCPRSRWAERKSRLAELEGFRFFTLMRRVGADGAEEEIPAEDPNYVSLTVRARSPLRWFRGLVPGAKTGAAAFGGEDCGQPARRPESWHGRRRHVSLTGVHTVGISDSKVAHATLLFHQVWEDKDTFTAWRTGEAFKEAHGGGAPPRRSNSNPVSHN